jgi:hypothetical protein
VPRIDEYCFRHVTVGGCGETHDVIVLLGRVVRGYRTL